MKILNFFAIFFAFLPAVANATVLTFDQDVVVDFVDVDLTYGDDVEATSEGTFGYGVGAEGFTPNVQLTYGSSDPALWTTGFGNLTNVLFEDTDNAGVLTVTFTADPGFLVQLYEFDVADFSSVDSTIDAVRVSDGTSTLFEELNATISSTTSTLFDFTAAPLTAPQLILEIDATNLGGANDNIGIDNVRFGQVAIPEPSTFVLALFGTVSFGWSRRRRGN